MIIIISWWLYSTHI